jgi:hypothetical protein
MIGIRYKLTKTATLRLRVLRLAKSKKEAKTIDKGQTNFGIHLQWARALPRATEFHIDFHPFVLLSRCYFALPPLCFRKFELSVSRNL